MRHLTTIARTTLQLSLALVAAASVGCSAPTSDAGDGDSEVTATSAAALNAGLGVWSWGTTDGKELDIGSWSTQTCFLSGVAGDLDSGFFGHGAFAGVRPEGLDYVVQAYGGLKGGNVPEGNAVNAHVSCTSITANRVRTGDLHLTGEHHPIAAWTPQRQCFLESVTGVEGGWVDDDNNARVWNDGANWFLSGSADFTHFSMASAVCIDFPIGSATQTATRGAGTSSAIGTAPGFGTVCGLTGIFGRFHLSSWTDGAMIDWPKSSTEFWRLTVSPGKTATSPGKSASYACVH